MKIDIRKKLFELKDEEYRKFHSKLCPGIDNIIGVRVPVLRKLAKQLSVEDGIGYLKELKDDYYEEIMLQGLIIAMSNQIDITDTKKYLDEFIPKIDNWAVCDIVCSSIKKTKKHLKEMWDYLDKYINSNKEFEKRFAVVMYMDYYLTDDYIDLVFKKINIKSDMYYVQMAIAWLVSVAYIKQKEKTKEFLKNNNLDDITYNKSLQKIIESNRVTGEEKDRIRKMKRK